MAHICHAIGCKTPVAPKLFMCAAHWRLVPKPMQNAVWATYRPGQERDKQPSTAYLIATHRAMIVVAKAEGTKVPGYLTTVLEVWERHEEDE